LKLIIFIKTKIPFIEGGGEGHGDAGLSQAEHEEVGRCKPERD
jgi:hypothetical protein